MVAKHILVVDDDPIVRSVLNEGLQSAGYQVSLASSGDEAQVVAKNNIDLDLAIIDYQMTPVDGFETARALTDSAGLHFVMLTAHLDEALVNEASRIGALGYLSKPINFETLRPNIEVAIARARQLGTREINMAIGIIAERQRLSTAEAFERLRLQSRRSRKRLAVLASELIRTFDLLHAMTDSSDKQQT